MASPQNASSFCSGVIANHLRGFPLLRGTALLGGTALLSLAAILASQELLRAQPKKLTTKISQTELWQLYRWSIDPQQRREAALLLAAKSKDSPLRRKRLLAGQGWGNSPLAAVALKLQAQNAKRLGEKSKANQLWQNLLKRFPNAAATADAYYYLGRQQPELRKQLLKLQPAHPAALESAIELEASNSQHQGAIHLSRWGIHWPGATDLMRSACKAPIKNGPSAQERQDLAIGLAKLDDGKTALSCLAEQPAKPAAALAIGQTLLRGDEEQKLQGESLLLRLAQEHPEAKESIEAAKLLSEPLHPKTALLEALPASLAENSPSVAAARVRLKDRKQAESLLQRWPDDPASWQLQWDLAREALLKGQWEKAKSVLKSIPTKKLPEPLAARKQFWIGFIAAKQGRNQEAKQIWEKLLKSNPSGYYTWRAQARLGQDDLPALSGEQLSISNSKPELGEWTPINSGDELVDTLWRLGLATDAWETWLNLHSETDRTIDTANNRVVEGRLRMAVGDYWTGLSQLWQASLRLVGEDCQMRQLLHRSQHPYRFWPAISKASRSSDIRPELLLAIAKQESRFSPGVKSSAGAVGLMQLMPETAAELSDGSLKKEELLNPQTNSKLGARYLANLLKHWQGNPWLTAASYNAGPGAVTEWLTSELKTDPELWVERIPYPETRIYTKKVLGNLWSYLHIGSKQPCKTGM
ncbi:MAG: transglycosylase SLT domain-containing protein [Prochlorococcus sp.]